MIIDSEEFVIYFPLNFCRVKYPDTHTTVNYHKLLSISKILTKSKNATSLQCIVTKFCPKWKILPIQKRSIDKKQLYYIILQNKMFGEVRLNETPEGNNNQLLIPATSNRFCEQKKVEKYHSFRTNIWNLLSTKHRSTFRNTTVRYFNLQSASFY